jgi:hypothetical protein
MRADRSREGKCSSHEMKWNKNEVRERERNGNEKWKLWTIYYVDQEMYKS